MSDRSPASPHSNHPSRYYSSPSMFRMASPLPTCASQWNDGHSEQLEIFYVPLEESNYLTTGSEIRGFKDGLALVDCEYDYKQLLRDVVKPNDEKWWDSFNKDYANVLEKIDENLKMPDISEASSLALTKYVFRKYSSSASACSAAGRKDRNAGTSAGNFVDNLPDSNLGQDRPASATDTSHVSSQTGRSEPVLSRSESRSQHADVKAKTVLNNLSKGISSNIIRYIEDEEMSLRMKHMRDVRHMENKRTSSDPDRLRDRLRDIMLFKDIANFLQSLRKVVVKYTQDEPTDETCFEYIFQSFSRIYFLDICRAPKRVMGIFGVEVSSVPNLRFETLQGTVNLVVTVAEVNKRAGESEIKTFPKKLDVIGLPSNLRGRHAAELLLELPYSALSSNDGNDYIVILGMIVQCTWVRLTCLKMRKRHLQLLREDKSQQLGDLRAEIHYSKAYDILKREGRRHLAYILLLIAYLNDDFFFEMYV